MSTMGITRRTYTLFGLFIVGTIFITTLFLKEKEPKTRILYRESFIPNKPHSHGEFDEVMNRIGKMDPINFVDQGEHSHAGEDIIAKMLYNKVRIFCWIMTGPSNHKTKAVHVKATWAKRCNKYVFMSSMEDKDLPSIDLKVEEGRNHLWGKTKAAFKYLYDKELNNFDFFIKADDDTYVVLENLRYMLLKVKPTDPVLFGRKFKPFVKQGYMSGGAGYVVSREGLRLIVEKGFGIHKNCRKDEGGAEDVHFGECAQAVGIIAGDSRDSLGRERFHPFPPDAHFRKIDKGNWLWSYNYYPLKTGTECCSDTSIAYHYVSPDWMYVLEYFVYHWHPYGIVRDVDAVRKVMKLDAHEHGFQVESEHHHDSSQDSGKAVEGRESLDEERKRLEEQRKKVEEDQKKAEDAMKAVLDEKSKMQKMHAEALDLQKKADETMTKAKEEMKKAEALGVEVLKMKSQKDQKM